MKTSKFNFFCGFGLLGFLILLLPVAQAEVCPAIGHPKDFTVLLADTDRSRQLPAGRSQLWHRTWMMG
ncbi:MAG: hypothetical protein RKO66_11395 [Candidatus Contendobacter sp.]|nr:hypothetical protein [Candidatus Contendobacter sp.]